MNFIFGLLTAYLSIIAIIFALLRFKEQEGIHLCTVCMEQIDSDCAKEKA